MSDSNASRAKQHLGSSVGITSSANAAEPRRAESPRPTPPVPLLSLPVLAERRSLSFANTVLQLLFENIAGVPRHEGDDGRLKSSA